MRLSESLVEGKSYIGLTYSIFTHNWRDFITTNRCRVCNVDLVVGENWYEAYANGHSYICKTCACNATKQRQTSNRKIYNEIRRKSYYRHGAKPMSENKDCSAYLGCHIAERVLSKVFKDVEVMPRNNPGYDFICNKGKKIDVKSACVSKYGKWVFHIRHNIIADYFLCLAFDNRDNLTPLHMWLIPGHIVNNLTGTTISKSTVNRWNEYRLDVDKVVKCCDKMRMG